MNIIKNVFSIKDLENLSGIKAHTIRIWEKRYGLLEPMRSETNIRHYDTANLQKLLNVSYLYNHNYKISKIAQFTPEKIVEIVNQLSASENNLNIAISQFKLAMMNFDVELFLTTYSEIELKTEFSTIFYDIFIPILNEIGFLWQTDTITPAHEHFISYLIKQKLLVQIEKVQLAPKKNDNTFILFLPHNEIHELGLLYLNYQLLSLGYKTIYLGPSIPTDSLIDLKKRFSQTTFITYMTVAPETDSLAAYLNDFEQKLLSDSALWVFGRMTEFINQTASKTKIKTFQNISELTEQLK